MGILADFPVGTSVISGPGPQVMEVIARDFESGTVLCQWTDANTFMHRYSFKPAELRAVRPTPEPSTTIYNKDRNFKAVQVMPPPVGLEDELPAVYALYVCKSFGGLYEKATTWPAGTDLPQMPDNAIPLLWSVKRKRWEVPD